MVDPGWHLVIPKKYLPYLGAGAAAVVTFAYILWGPDVDRGFNSRSGSKRKVAGLENLGNTCYLNTILQSLAACPGFVKWLSRALRRGFFKGKHNELAYKLSKTIEVVNDYSSSHSGAQVYSPHEVLHALYGCSWKSDRDQQDAHELFQFLLSVLGEDKEPVPSPLPLCDTSRFTEFDRSDFTQPDLHSNIEADLPKVSNKDGESPFRGLLANHLSCTVCGHKNPVTYSSFDCLTIPLPLSAFGTLSLEIVLAKFTQSELVHDVQCTECAEKLIGRTKQPPTKKLKSLAQTPKLRRDVKRRISSSVTTPAVTSATTTETLERVSPASETTPVWSGKTTVITPEGMHSSMEVTPPSTLAPLNCRIARPTNDQGCGFVSQSGRSLSDEDLHMRTSPSEKVSSDTSSTGYDTGSSGLEDRHGNVNNGENRQKPFQQVGLEVTLTSCRDNNGSVAETEFFPEPSINGNVMNVEEGALSMHKKTSTLQTEGSVDERALQDLDKPQQDLNGGHISIENPKSCLHNPCTNESMTQEVTKLSAECALANGVCEELSDKIKILNSSQTLESTQETNFGHQVPTTNRSVPTGKHVNGNHPTISQGLNKDMGSGFRSNNDADSSADRSSQPVDESNIAPPKCHSTPKTRPPPLKPASSSANQSIASEATPTRSPSVFGKIPGTDGLTLTPRDNVTNDNDNEDLSLKCRRIFRKQLTLGKLPQCLCIHLQRVTWLSNGLPSRREEHIVFPEYLDMSLYKQTTAVNYTAQTTTQSGVKLLRLLSEEDPMPSQPPQRKASHGFIGSNFLAESGSKSPVGVSVPQLSPRISHQAPGFPVAEDGTTRQERTEGRVSSQSWRSADSLYRLASAVVHHGDAYSGHFLTFRRAPSTGTEVLSDNWLCVSDESVYASTRKEVFSQKAYMLYYQRM